MQEFMVSHHWQMTTLEHSTRAMSKPAAAVFVPHKQQLSYASLHLLPTDERVSDVGIRYYFTLELLPSFLLNFPKSRLIRESRF